MTMHGMIEVAVRFLVTGLSVLLVAAVLPGMRVHRYRDAVFFAVVVAVLNVIAYSFLSWITWPSILLTFGIGYFVINGIIFLIAKNVVKGVEISGCLIAILASILVSLVNTILSRFIHI